MQTHLVTILKKMAAVDGVEKPAAVLLDQSILQANCKSNTIAFAIAIAALSDGQAPARNGRSSPI